MIANVTHSSNSNGTHRYEVNGEAHTKQSRRYYTHASVYAWITDSQGFEIGRLVVALHSRLDLAVKGHTQYNSMVKAGYLKRLGTVEIVDLDTEDTTTEDTTERNHTMNTKTTKTTDPVEFNQCLCGCEANVPVKSNYKPGHDARHAGIVARAAIAQDELPYDAAENYVDLPSPALRHKALLIAANKVSKAAGRRNTKTAEVPSTVKIGRWEYPARMTRAGKLERNTKRDGSGSWTPVDA